MQVLVHMMHTSSGLFGRLKPILQRTMPLRLWPSRIASPVKMARKPCLNTTHTLSPSATNYTYMAHRASLPSHITCPTGHK